MVKIGLFTNIKSHLLQNYSIRNNIYLITWVCKKLCVNGKIGTMQIVPILVIKNKIWKSKNLVKRN